MSSGTLLSDRLELAWSFTTATSTVVADAHDHQNVVTDTTPHLYYVSTSAVANFANSSDIRPFVVSTETPSDPDTGGGSIGGGISTGGSGIGNDLPGLGSGSSGSGGVGGVVPEPSSLAVLLVISPLLRRRLPRRR